MLVVHLRSSTLAWQHRHTRMPHLIHHGCVTGVCARPGRGLARPDPRLPGWCAPPGAGSWPGAPPQGGVRRPRGVGGEGGCGARRQGGPCGQGRRWVGSSSMLREIPCMAGVALFRIRLDQGLVPPAFSQTITLTFHRLACTLPHIRSDPGPVPYIHSQRTTCYSHWLTYRWPAWGWSGACSAWGCRSDIRAGSPPEARRWPGV